ncbi:hypothetical protein LshimejAT787_0103920 [Lyophyllum shimeji]|uniref:Uncharacterized protein n=1 Tax=Lyophyllum shimeji TaxID=47721 RepID=A0A9P3PCY6_LYOSH|nr:hypothetical protein LshimejAT787_0103920 [Lyophyllum shimeji]
MDPPGEFPAATGPFNECVEFQEASTELVVYSPIVRQIVTIAWPLFQKKRIVPKGIKAWLRTRGLHWSCFCPLVSGKSTLSSRIVESLDGEVLIFCNAYPSNCGFFLNLTSIHHSAALEAEYDLPTLASGRKPPMKELSMAFNLDTVGDAELGPYFEGYCGEHYPNVEQLSGAEIALDLALNRQNKTPRQFATINPSKNRHQARRLSRPTSLTHRRGGHPYEHVKKQVSIRSLPLAPLPKDSPFPFSSSSLCATSLSLSDPSRPSTPRGSVSAHASTSRSSISAHASTSRSSIPAHALTSSSSISALPRLTLSAFGDRSTTIAHSAPEFTPEDRNEGPADWRVQVQDIFGRLSAGQGVCPREWDGLVELCSKCMEVFTPWALKRHIPECDGSIIL